MKRLLPVLIVLLLAGCASFQEAYLLDHEFGRDSAAAWQQQVANPHPAQVGAIPTGLEGITAEELMSIYNGTFAEKPLQQNVLSLTLPTH